MFCFYYNSKSTIFQVTLSPLMLATTGRYRCEVNMVLMVVIVVIVVMVVMVVMAMIVVRVVR